MDVARPTGLATGHCRKNLINMSEHQIETAFLRRVILYEDSDERRKLERSIAQVQQDERCVQRLAWAIGLFPMLALAAVVYGAFLQENFPYNVSNAVLNVFGGLVLASLICLVAFGGLLTVYRRKLNRLRQECRQLITRLLESHVGKPHLPSLPGSPRGSDNREALRGPLESGVLLVDSLVVSDLRSRMESP
jgi:hypothetical protein